MLDIKYYTGLRAMSRSRKHTPIMSWAICRSCKQWRTQENQLYRAYVRDMMAHELYDDIQGFCGKFGNEWDSPRDGKVWWKTTTWKDMRK